MRLLPFTIVLLSTLSGRLIAEEPASPGDDRVFATYSADDVVERDGVVVIRASGVPVTGKVVWLFWNGGTEAVFEYVDGLKHGLFRAYNRKGVLVYSEEQRGGKPNGIAREFFADGSLECEYTFVDGKPNGRFVRRYPSGAVRVTGCYRLGFKEGEWRSFAEDGAMQSLVVFKDGILQSDAIYIDDIKLAWEFYQEKLQTTAEPGATDNPDDAQSLRDDH